MLKSRKFFDYFLIGLYSLGLAIFYWCSIRDTPIRIWDEAIYSNNAIEMAETGEYFVLTNNGEPSLYNTKPPFAIWLQSFSIRIFGISEFAVRLPSLISLLGTAWVMIIFMGRTGISRTGKLFSLLIFLTTGGVMSYHVGLTGDLDAVLMFWAVCLSVTAFDIVLNFNNGRLSTKIWLGALFFLGGFLTKSTAIFLLLPGILALFLISPHRKSIILNRHLFIAGGVSLLLICLYYLYMNDRFPDYFKTVWHSEFQRFYVNIMPWHNHPWYFYFKNLLTRFTPWIWILFAQLLLLIRGTSVKLVSLKPVAFIYCFIYLSVITIPEVKLAWYDSPVLPILALLTGIFLAEIVEKIRKRYRRLILITIVLLVLYRMYSLAVEAANIQYEPAELEGSLIRSSFNQFRPQKSKVFLTVEYEEHLDQLHFYRKKYLKEFNSEILITGDINEIHAGDTLFICQSDKIEKVSRAFNLDTLHYFNNCIMAGVKGIKAK